MSTQTNFPFYGNAIYGAVINLPTGVPDGAMAITLDTYSLWVYKAATATWVNPDLTVSGVLSLTAGTAAAPSLNFSDTTTGFYRPAANQLGFSVSGTAAGIFSATSSNLAAPSLRVGSITPDTSTGLRVSSTGLTSTSPNVLYADPVLPATATAGFGGCTISPSTVASAFVLPYYIGFFPQDMTLGAGSSLTRSVGFYVPDRTIGTHLASIADNLSFTGSWFINYAGTLASTIGGAVTVGGVLSATVGGIKTKLSTANTSNPPTNAELISAFGAAATTGAGFVGVVDDNAAHTNEYLIFSDGTKYWQITATAAA